MSTILITIRCFQNNNETLKRPSEWFARNAPAFLHYSLYGTRSSLAIAFETSRASTRTGAAGSRSSWIRSNAIHFGRGRERDVITRPGTMKTCRLLHTGQQSFTCPRKQWRRRRRRRRPPKRTIRACIYHIVVLYVSPARRRPLYDYYCRCYMCTRYCYCRVLFYEQTENSSLNRPFPNISITFWAMFGTPAGTHIALHCSDRPL